MSKGHLTANIGKINPAGILYFTANKAESLVLE